MHLVLYTKGHKCTSTGAQLIFFSNCIFRCRFNYLNLYFVFFTTIDNKFDNLHLYLKLAHGSLCGKKPKCPKKTPCTSGRPPYPFLYNHCQSRESNPVLSNEKRVHYPLHNVHMCTPFYYYMYIKSVREQHLIQLFSGGYVDRENFDYGEF